MLRIAVSPTLFGRWHSQCVQAALRNVGIAHLMVEWSDSPENALLRGDADAAACWLNDWPPARGNEAVVVGAILLREHPFDLLLWRPEAADPKQDFFLKQEATVLSATVLQKAQIGEVRPDLRWAAAQTDLVEALQCLREGAADALVVAQADAIALGIDLVKWPHTLLHPSECTPVPGQGALALLVRRDDTPTRQQLRCVHQPRLSACTNAERRLLREGHRHYPNTTIGAYAEQDANTFFHFFVAILWPDGSLQRYRLSHSTHAELAEQTLQYLQGHASHSRT